MKIVLMMAVLFIAGLGIAAPAQANADDNFINELNYYGVTVYPVQRQEMVDTGHAICKELETTPLGELIDDLIAYSQSPNSYSQSPNKFTKFTPQQIQDLVITAGNNLCPWAVRHGR